MKILVYASTIILTLLIISFSNAESFEMPQFQITWKDGSTYGVLLDQKLSDSNISEIIYELREIRKRGDFSKYFPRTTPGLKDKYGVIQVQIFTNPKWADKKMASDYVNQRMDKKIEQEYINNIRGYYGWQSNNHFEVGEIGYSEGKLKSTKYKKLF